MPYKNSEKRRAFQKRYAKQHPEKIKAWAHNTYQKHKEKRLEQSRKYRLEHPDLYKNASRLWNLSHKERRKEISRTWRKRNLRKDALKSKRYRLMHPDRISANKRRYHIANRDAILRKRKREYAILRLNAIKHYSNGIMKCSKCDVIGLPFLNIDHTHGRKTVGHEKFGSVMLYRYLRHHNYPLGFQVLCWNCNKIKEIERLRTYSTNPDAVWNRKRHKEIKIEVFSHYSNGIPKCNCCGFSKLEGLSIDHIKGRKESRPSAGLLGHELYAWLKRNGYPQDYQVMCFNCNCAKSDKGVCPHKIIRT